MDCPICATPHGGWHQLHRHLVDAHPEAVTRTEGAGGAPALVVHCPACTWSFEKVLSGQRREEAFAAEFGREMALVAFDQLMVHWVEDHVADPDDDSMGDESGDSQRVQPAG